MKRRTRWRIPSYVAVSLVLAPFLVQITRTQSVPPSAASTDGYTAEESPTGEINVYTNDADGTAGPLAYALDADGDLSINVTSLWLYFASTGELPALPPSLVSSLGDMMNTLDLEGTADLFRNSSFLDSFVTQLNSSFPEWMSRFDQIIESRDLFLEGIGVSSVAEGSRSSGSSNTVALVVGIVLAVLAVVVVGLGALMYVIVKRRRQAGTVMIMDGGPHGSKGFSVVSGSTYYDDALSLKSATTLMLAQDAVVDRGSVQISCVDGQQGDGVSVVSKLSADPVLRWVMEQAGEPLSPGGKSPEGSERQRDSGDRSDADRSDADRSSDSSPSSGSASPKSGESVGKALAVGRAGKHVGQIPDFLSNLQFSWGELKVARSLGSGAYGKVYLARWNETPVAVKVLLDGHSIALSDGSGHSPSPNRMLEEIKITAALRHPNVVQFMGFCLSPPSMAAEYCPRGSLYGVLHGTTPSTSTSDVSCKAKAPVSWLRRVAFAADGAAGMLHLHTRNPLILHRDLNSPNLLVSADWTVKVADMGLSKLLTDSALECGINSVVTSGGGVNPRWLAPEILRGESCTKASDVFSFGVIMWEILTRRVPWDRETTWSIVGQVQNGGRLRVDDDTVERTDDMDDESVEEYIALMQACWDQDPDKRPEFGAIAGGLRELQKKILDAL